MSARRRVASLFGGVCWCLIGCGLLEAAEFPPPPGEVRSLAVYPERVTLVGSDAAAQLVVTATMADGRLVDLTGAVTYAVADAGCAEVRPGGRVLPRADGATEVVVGYGDRTVRVPVEVRAVADELPLNFAHRVVPVFTKLGCNSGGCHGKLSGQNGFRLSLLGFEPELDYTTLVKEGRGRRLFPANPDASLLLTKATGRVPHGGGKKLDPDSDEYRLVRRWIAAGMPWGHPGDPTLVRIRVYPERRILGRGGRQQIAVYADYSDGSVEDITRRAQYESNDPDIATVDANGLVRTQQLGGEAAVMARYQGRVAVFRATVPLGRPTPPWTFEPRTVVDIHTANKWRELGLVPSPTCSDEVFVRRVHLDLTGTLPTPRQVTEFLASTDPAKRDKLIDALLETPEYAYFFASKWADILRVKRRNEPERAAGTFAFHEWIRQQIARDTPYSEFVRAVLTARGTETTNPPTVWYKEVDKPDSFVDDVGQVFLGQRLACANCHHHPYEKWSQDDYWGLAAFFARVGVKTWSRPGLDPGRDPRQVRLVYTRSAGSVVNKRTNQPAVTKPLDADPVPVGPDEDPRQKLVDWMVDPANPFFARAVANRYWAHFFGRGIVDPPDDMRVTNPPTNPELLNALAHDLIQNNFSLKALIKTITKSRTYRLDSEPNEFNKEDRQAYARYYPKRLPAEVLLDALSQATDSPSRFPGLPGDRHAPNRAVMLPDESFPSYFLDVTGRPQRISACECERVNEASLAAVLHMLNSDEVQGKISRPGGRADRLAADPRSDAEKVEELFLWVLCRRPTDADRRSALAHIAEQLAKNPQNPAAARKAAYENILWALVNTKEFWFNR